MLHYLSQVVNSHNKTNQLSRFNQKSCKKVKKSPQKLEINIQEITTKKQQAIQPDDYTINLNNLDKNEKNIILKNTGGEVLNLNSIELSDMSGLFSLDKGDCNGKNELNADEKCTMKVKFTGETEGNFKAKIKIDSNDLRKSKTLLGINATAENKYIAALTTSSAKKPVLDPMKKLNFNIVENKQYVTIKNIGYEPLPLDQLRLKGENKKSFSIKSNCNSVLKIDEECEVEVNFDPKTSGAQLAYLQIATKGMVQPSSKVRLNGVSEPFNIEVSNFIVSKNIKLFLDDYFQSDDSFFARTSFQTQNNEKFESYLQENINEYAKANGLNIVSNPTKASKILNLYPVIKVASDTKSAKMNIKVAVNGTYEVKINNSQINGNDVTSTSTLQDQSITAIKSEKLITSAQPFEFAIEIDATSFQDEYDIYKKASQIISDKLYNILGLQSKKD